MAHIHPPAAGLARRASSGHSGENTVSQNLQLFAFFALIVAHVLAVFFARTCRTDVDAVG